MSQQSATVSTKSFAGLQCGACGNRDLFVEIMDYETHLVDGQLNYLHLLVAETDRYECNACGALIEFDLNAGCK